MSTPTSRPPGHRPPLAGGELLEYGCHLTIEAGPQMVTHDLTRPGLILIGRRRLHPRHRPDDPAWTSPLGPHSRRPRPSNGRDAGDFSQAATDAYGAELAKSFVGADIKTYAHAPALLEVERMYADLRSLLADVLYGMFNHSTSPGAGTPGRPPDARGVRDQEARPGQGRLARLSGSFLQGRTHEAGTVAERRTPNVYNLDEEESHIVVDQDVARRTGTDACSSGVCADVYSEQADGSIRVEYAACLERGTCLAVVAPAR